MKEAKDHIPWKVVDLPIRPFEGFWSFNPSIHFDGQRWLCAQRNCDYSMPGGVTVRGKKSGPGHQTKNAMLVLDPATWQPTQVFKMHERDDHPRVACANVGFEDMRIFKTARGGLQGIAASLHLKREQRPADGGAHNQPPEQVLLSFDAEYNIVAARPIRGAWSGTAQKNWMPFDGCVEPRFLYSIGRGSMFDVRGAIHGDGARAVAMARAVAAPPIAGHGARAVATQPREEHERQERQEREAQEQRANEEREVQEQRARKERIEHEERKKSASKRHPDPRVRMSIRSMETAVVRGGRAAATAGRRVAVETTTTRHHAGARGDDATRMMGTGRTVLPRYEGLRGGSQLLAVSEDAWLGIGHEMKFVKGLKYYWHTWFLTDARGKLKAASEPMKLSGQHGIEFAAGMAIDGDRLVVSFGVDDGECKLGETRLSAVMEQLRPVEP